MTVIEACKLAGYSSLSSWEDSLIQRINNSPPTLHGSLGLGLWMTEHINIAEQEIFQAMEDHYGEEWCNSWFSSVLVRTNYYKAADDGTMVELLESPALSLESPA